MQIMNDIMNSIIIQYFWKFISLVINYSQNLLLDALVIVDNWILFCSLLLRPTLSSHLYIFSNMQNLTSRKKLHGQSQMPPRGVLTSRFSIVLLFHWIFFFTYANTSIVKTYLFCLHIFKILCILPVLSGFISCLPILFSLYWFWAYLMCKYHIKCFVSCGS